MDFRTVFEAVPGCYLLLAADRPRFTIVAVSDAYLRATMTSRHEIVGRALFDVFPDNPEDPAATGTRNLHESLERVIESRKPDTMAVQKYDIRRPESEGGGFEERHWSPVNSPVLDAAGEVACILHRVEDVTDYVRLRQQGREQLRVNEELRSRAGAMEVEIYRRAQEIQEANRQLHELQAQLEQRVRDRTAELEQSNANLQEEARQRQRAQEALQQSEERLRQAQKMEAIGRLAGGIAHDFNNLLCVILGYSEQALEQLPAGAPIRREITELQRAGVRAADLTRQLLAFSRQQVLQVAVLDLNSVLRNLHKMLRRLLPEDITLTLHLRDDLGAVRADRGQLEQVVMNLVVNARDAMPGGGTLTVETAGVELDDAYARDYPEVTPGPHVMLGVSDTGIGMDRATQTRIFEPFFTTKGIGKGTGLGLSTAFGIIKQLGGHIWVYSEPNVGTTFKIYLPRVDAVPSEAAPPPVAAEVHHGSETILLAEDDPEVRRMVAAGLRRAGYTVLEAARPSEALALAQRHPGAIDLLLTDVVMPETNGRELAERLRQLRAETRVLFMSGYTDDAIVRHGILELGVAFIQKPLTPEALRRKVRDVLSTPKAER